MHDSHLLTVAPQDLKPGDEIEVRGRRPHFVVSLITITPTSCVRVHGEKTAAGNKRRPLYFWPHQKIAVYRNPDNAPAPQKVLT